MTTKYVCAIPLPEAIAASVRMIQESYKSSSWNIDIEPHITLLSPGIMLASPADAIEMLSSLARKFRSFDIEVDGIGRFQNQSNTVFAKVIPSEELSLLQRELLRCSPSFMARAGVQHEEFLPHITLSNKLHSLLAEQVALQLAEERIHFTFQCHGFCLYKKDSNEKQWSTLKQLSF